MNYLRIVDLEAVILGGSLVEQLHGWFEWVERAVSEQPGFHIQLIRGENETENTLRGIALQYVMSVLQK